MLFLVGERMGMGLWMIKHILEASYRPDEGKIESKYFISPAQISLATPKELSVLITSLSPEALLPIDDFSLVYPMGILTKNRKSYHACTCSVGEKGKFLNIFQRII